MDSIYDIYKSYAQNPDLNPFYTPKSNLGAGMNTIVNSPVNITAPLQRSLPANELLKVRNNLRQLNQTREKNDVQNFKPVLSSLQETFNSNLIKQTNNPKSRLNKYFPVNNNINNSSKLPKAQGGLDTSLLTGSTGTTGTTNALSGLTGALGGGMSMGDPTMIAIQTGVGIAKNLATGTKDVVNKIQDNASTATKYNKSENTLGTIGMGLDKLTHLIPGASTIMDIFGTSFEDIGSQIGKKWFDPNSPKSYTPSGNTTGNFSKYQTGGNANLFKSPLPYKEGSNKNYAMYQDRLNHTLALDEKYGFPFGTTAALGLSEAKRWDTSNNLVFNDDNVTHKTSGAQGPYQLMPDVVKSKNVTNPYDFFSAAEAAASHLNDYQKRFGSLEHALKAYNFGETAYNSYLQGKRSLPKETQNYVKRFANTANRFLGYPLPIVVVTAPRSYAAR